MKREIFIVHAYIVDANGTFNYLDGYPKPFDSKQNNNDIEATRNKALSDYYTVLSAMAKRTDRQLQRASIRVASNGGNIGDTAFGELAELPDPEPEPEQTT